MQPTSQQKSPNRRPGGRARNGNQKTYASENDLPRYRLDSSAHPSTPQKGASGGDQSLRSNSTGQKQRNKNSNNNSGKKPRHKNGPLSPGSSRGNRQSPSVPSKQASAPIFAGSTFHASPAPSALPIPSFLSKPEVDSPTVKPTSSPEPVTNSAATESDEAGPPSPLPVPVSRTEESPLELFFRADRAEKARTRRASSANIDATPTSPFVLGREPPQERSAPPNPIEPHAARCPQYPKRPSAVGISANELDGNPGQPVGPAFSTPYQERMRAALRHPSSTQTTPTTIRNQDISSHLDSPSALKRYLFTGRLGLDGETPAPLATPPKQPFHEHTEPIANSVKQFKPPDQHQAAPQHRLPRGMFPASVLTANSQSGQPPAPPTHAQLTSYRSEQLVAMEDGLKRILNLDPSNQSLPLR
ncbi:hypothetical protein GGR52DRAFT_16149 [Hypoxylon sp. FL1284]|nr:hypothetical protein GGR52DRAFT_16149 [Hypoxylon sp. FL1284]